MSAFLFLEDRATRDGARTSGKKRTRDCAVSIPEQFRLFGYEINITPMSFILRKGQGYRTIWLPMTASTAVTKNTLVTLTSGQIVAAAAGTATVDLVGVMGKTTASTDSDYATAGRLVPILIPRERFATYEADSATLASATIGAEYDLSDGNTVNPAANSVKIVKYIGAISTLKGLFFVKFGGAY